MRHVRVVHDRGEVGSYMRTPGFPGVNLKLEC